MTATDWAVDAVVAAGRVRLRVPAADPDRQPSDPRRGAAPHARHRGRGPDGVRPRRPRVDGCSPYRPARGSLGGVRPLHAVLVHLPIPGGRGAAVRSWGRSSLCSRSPSSVRATRPSSPGLGARGLAFAPAGSSWTLTSLTFMQNAAFMAVAAFAGYALRGAAGLRSRRRGAGLARRSGRARARRGAAWRARAHRARGARHHRALAVGGERSGRRGRATWTWIPAAKRGHIGGALDGEVGA